MPKYHVVMEDGTDGIVDARNGSEVWAKAKSRGKAVLLVEEIEGEDYAGTRDADRAEARSVAPEPKVRKVEDKPAPSEFDKKE